MNNDVPESLRKFEGELERAIKRRLELASARRRRARPRILAGTTLALAGLAAALTLAFTAASSPPAFAVTRNHDGTVSVKIMRLEGLRGANARLAAMNVPAKLVQVSAACAQPPLPTPRGLKWRLARAQLRPARIPPGRTLVIVVRRLGRAVRVAPGHLVAGPPPSCLPPIPFPCGVHKVVVTRHGGQVANKVLHSLPPLRARGVAHGAQVRGACKAPPPPSKH